MEREGDGQDRFLVCIGPCERANIRTEEEEHPTVQPTFWKTKIKVEIDTCEVGKGKEVSVPVWGTS